MVAKTAHELAYEASRVPETIQVVSSFLKRNSIPSGEVAGTVRDIHRALLEIAGDAGVFERSLVQLDASAARYLGTSDTSGATAEEYLPSLRLAALENLGLAAPPLALPSPAPSPPAPAPAAPAQTLPAAPVEARAPDPEPSPAAARSDPGVVPPSEAPAAPAAKRPSRSKPRAVPDQPSLFSPAPAPAPAPAAPAATPAPVTARGANGRFAPAARPTTATVAPTARTARKAPAGPAPEPVVARASAPTAQAPEPAPTAGRAPSPAPRPERAKPIKRVPAEESVQMEFLICLEDGKKTRDLTRHLYERHSMTPEEYREKWGLPDSYPMTPPGLILRKAELFEFDPITRSLNPVNR